MHPRVLVFAVVLGVVLDDLGPEIFCLSADGVVRRTVLRRRIL